MLNPDSCCLVTLRVAPRFGSVALRLGWHFFRLPGVEVLQEVGGVGA